MRHRITQPFKQAHREVYLITDAERATATHSNRFAAHILRQHQLRALCEQRGWRHRLQGAFFDGGNWPTLPLPRHGLEAECLVDVARQSEHSHPGIALLVGIDRLQFVDRAGRGIVPLEEVPPVVFSEVMRDLDLFVGVCSLGVDPT